MMVEVNDIVEVKLLGGRLVDTGKVVEIYKFNGQKEFMMLSHEVSPGQVVSFGERHVSRIISKG
jgi:hypothetical protein